MYSNFKSSNSLKLVILGIYIILLGQSIQAQSYHYSAKDLKDKTKADQYYQQENYTKALLIYESLFNRNKKDLELGKAVAKCYFKIRNLQKAKEWHERLLVQFEDRDPEIYLTYGLILMQLQQYEAARIQFLEYNTLIEQSDEYATQYLKNIEYIDTYYKDSAHYHVKLLDLNTKKAEYSPAFQDEILYFISSKHTDDQLIIKHYSDVLKANHTGQDNFSVPKKLGNHINDKDGVISLCFNSNRNEAYITRFIQNEEKEMVFRHRIFRCNYDTQSKRLGNPEMLSFGDFYYEVAYPALNPEGNIIVFASNAPGGYGGWDLYKASRTSGGFARVQNLGQSVNTPGDDLYPYFLNDSILFVASNGRGGLGGFDIFSYNLKEKTPVFRNMGYPINSSADDYGLVFNSNQSGIFTSNRKQGMGSEDLYSFQVAQIEVTGLVVDAERDENLKNVDVAILLSDSRIDSIQLADNGLFRIMSEPGKQFEIFISKSGYIDQSFYIDLENVTYSGALSYDLGNFKITLDSTMRSETIIEPIAIIQEPIEQESVLVAPIIIMDEEPEDVIAVSDEPEENKAIVEETLEEEITPESDSPEAIQHQVVFRVQIAASREPIHESVLKRKYQGDREIIMYLEKGWYKYAIGEFPDFQQANELRKVCGVKDAFIAVYNGEEKITLTEGVRLTRSNSNP